MNDQSISDISSVVQITLGAIIFPGFGKAFDMNYVLFIVNKRHESRRQDQYGS